MGAGDDALAWEHLRRSTEYRYAGGVRAGVPVYEAAPFPAQIQSDADLIATRFSHLVRKHLNQEAVSALSVWPPEGPQS